MTKPEIIVEKIINMINADDSEIHISENKMTIEWGDYIIHIHFGNNSGVDMIHICKYKTEPLKLFRFIPLWNVKCCEYDIWLSSSDYNFDGGENVNDLYEYYTDARLKKENDFKQEQINKKINRLDVAIDVLGEHNDRK